MDIDLFIQEVKEETRHIALRSRVTEFYKGQVLWLKIPENWGIGVIVTRVNKKTLTVYRIGMNNSDHFIPKHLRMDKISISAILNSDSKEISRNEAARMLYAAKLYNSQEKIEQKKDEMCVMGSRKHSKLMSGEIATRVGDFVKSKTTGFCGHVINDWIYVKPLGFCQLVQGSDGTNQPIVTTDIQFVAPREWK